MRREKCHVCARWAGVLKDGRIAKHFRINHLGHRELCLGAGQMYRPPLAEHFLIVPKEKARW